MSYGRHNVIKFLNVQEDILKVHDICPLLHLFLIGANTLRVKKNMLEFIINVLYHVRLTFFSVNSIVKTVWHRNQFIDRTMYQIVFHSVPGYVYEAFEAALYVQFWLWEDCIKM